MEIWTIPLTVDALNKRSKKTLAEWLDIKFTEIGDDFLTATMPVDHRTVQPIGLLHGGANCVLAETIASTAANCCVPNETHYCVGLEINANHIRSARSGIVTGISKAIHLGKTTQVWQTDIFDENNQQICVSRMTAAVIKRT